MERNQYTNTKRKLIPEKKQNYITIKENIVEIQNFEPLLCYIGVVTTNKITTSQNSVILTDRIRTCFWDQPDQD